MSGIVSCEAVESKSIGAPHSGAEEPDQDLSFFIGLVAGWSYGEACAIRVEATSSLRRA